MKTKSKQQLYLRCLFIIFYLVSSIYQIRYGANCDVAPISSWASRTARGDFPLVNTWGPFCVSAWLVGFVLRIVYMFDEYFTYGFLVMKILGVVLQFFTSMIFYFYTRKRVSEDRAFWASAILAIFVPYYMYIFVSHYNLAYLLTILIAVAVMNTNQYHDKIHAVILAVLFTVAILAMPTMVIIVPVALGSVYLLDKKNAMMINKTLVLMAVFFAIGVGILYTKGGALSDIRHLFCTGAAHGTGFLQQTVIRFRVLIPLFIATCIYSFVFLKLDKKQYELSILIIILAIGSIVIWIVTHENSQLMRAVFFSDIILGMWSCIHYKNVRSDLRRIFECLCILGVTLGLICAMSTNTGSMVASIGLIIPFAGYLAFVDAETDKGHTGIIIAIFIVLVFVQRICITDGWVNTTGTECSVKIDRGVLKGVYVTESSADKYYRIWRIIDHNVDDNDSLLLYGDERTLYYGYMMTNAKNAGNTVDDMEDGYVSYREYYEMYPERIPTKIIMPGEEFSNESAVDDTEFVAWVKQNYYLMNVEEGYLVLSNSE